MVYTRAVPVFGNGLHKGSTCVRANRRQSNTCVWGCSKQARSVPVPANVEDEDNQYLCLRMLEMKMALNGSKAVSVFGARESYRQMQYLWSGMLKMKMTLSVSKARRMAGAAARQYTRLWYGPNSPICFSTSSNFMVQPAASVYRQDEKDTFTTRCETIPPYASARRQTSWCSNPLLCTKRAKRTHLQLGVRPTSFSLYYIREALDSTVNSNSIHNNNNREACTRPIL